MSAQTVVRKYAIQHYGNLISVGEPEFDSEGKVWVAELLSDYPRIIHDDRNPNERILKFLSLRRLGAIKIGENLEPIDATPRETCVNNLSGYLNMWQERAERIIVRASADNFANINDAQWVLGQIGTIIARLKWKNMILDNEIEALPINAASKLRKYLQLLEGLDIVTHNNNGYSYGNLFSELSAQTNNDFEMLSTAILSTIIKERYSALRETFGINQLESFIHVDSCYYKPALEAEDLIYWNMNSFTHHCVMLYGNKSRVIFRLPYILEELVRVKALEYQDKLFFGNAELFKEMQNLQGEMTELAPLRA